MKKPLSMQTMKLISSLQDSIDKHWSRSHRFLNKAERDYNNEVIQQEKAVQDTLTLVERWLKKAVKGATK
jgi:hypothetical protein